MASSYARSQNSPTHAIFYTKDVVIKKDTPAPVFPRSKRRHIHLFSASSQRRLLHVARNSGHYIKSQLCLTYHFAMPDNGREVKQQLNSFLTLLREKYPGIKYLWVLEFQKRGVPHFHLFTDVCPSKVAFRTWCAITWNRICGEDKKHLSFQDHAKNFIPWRMASGRYLVKEYLAKASQKDIPQNYHSVGRFWGNSRNLIPIDTVVVPGRDCSEESFKKAVRIVTKRREKHLREIFKKFKVNLKKNYRNIARTYSLPNMTDIFINLIQYFEEDINAYSYQRL